MSTKVLVISAKIANVILIKDAIENMSDNYTVLTSIETREGLDMAHTDRPEVVIVHTTLPEINAFYICQKIKEVDPEIKVIILTDSLDANDVIRAREVGADKFCINSLGYGALLNSFNELVAPDGNPTV